MWYRRLDSNQHRRASKARILPLDHSGVVRDEGVEPSTLGWKPSTFPLRQSRSSGAGDRNRTCCQSVKSRLLAIELHPRGGGVGEIRTHSQRVKNPLHNRCATTPVGRHRRAFPTSSSTIRLSVHAGGIEPPWPKRSVYSRLSPPPAQRVHSIFIGAGNGDRTRGLLVGNEARYHFAIPALEPPTGIEPEPSALRKRRSALELQWRCTPSWSRTSQDRFWRPIPSPEAGAKTKKAGHPSVSGP